MTLRRSNRCAVLREDGAESSWLVDVKPISQRAKGHTKVAQLLSKARGQVGARGRLPLALALSAGQPAGC